MPFPDFMDLQTIAIFIAFIIVVFVLYKLFKLLFKATLVTIAAFSFPWIVKALGLPFPIEANVETGIYFAVAGLGLFFAYEFFHFIVRFFRILASPFRPHNEGKRLEKEMKKMRKDEGEK